MSHTLHQVALVLIRVPLHGRACSPHPTIQIAPATVPELEVPVIDKKPEDADQEVRGACMLICGGVAGRAGAAAAA